MYQDFWVWVEVFFVACFFVGLGVFLFYLLSFFVYFGGVL